MNNKPPTILFIIDAIIIIGIWSTHYVLHLFFLHFSLWRKKWAGKHFYLFFVRFCARFFSGLRNKICIIPFKRRCSRKSIVQVISILQYGLKFYWLKIY